MRRETVGIIGVGRLGGVLAARLVTRRDVLVCDVSPSAERRACSRPGIRSAGVAKLLTKCRLVLLCTPRDQTAELVREARAGGRPHAVLVSLSTASLEDELNGPSGNRQGLVQAKLIGQFKAIEYGIPGLIVASGEAEDLATLADVMADLARVVDERTTGVAELNRFATIAGLAMGAAFKSYCKENSIPDHWCEAAMHNVLVGTLIDFPPDPENAYAAGLLKEMEGR